MTTVNKQAIVSFANSNGNYVQGMARLSDSLRNNFTGDFLGFVHEHTIGAPLHSESNYAFKIHATQKAIDAGYKKILWLDASCFAVAPVQPIFDVIAEEGFIFQDAGHYLGTWCNDRTLDYFDISRDEAMEIRLMGNAGFLGFDLDSSLGYEFWKQYSKSMRKGYFHGAWNNDDKSQSQDERCRGHRHDITCATAILFKLGVLDLMKSGNEWLQYAGPYDKTANDSIIIKAQGL